MILVFAALCGCRSTRYIPVERAEVSVERAEADTTAIYAYIRSLILSQRQHTSSTDSIIDRMKETVTLNAQGDTTMLIREHNTYTSSAREKELEAQLAEKTDFIMALSRELMTLRADTIREPYPVEVPVSVERKRPWWETALICAGAILTLALAGSAIILIRSRKPRG